MSDTATSAHPNAARRSGPRRLPIWAPPLLYVVAAIIGIVAALPTGNIGLPYLLAFAAAAVIGTMLVDPRGLVVTVAQQPLMFTIFTPIVAWLIGSWSDPSVGGALDSTPTKTRLITAAYPIVQYFPWMAAIPVVCTAIAIWRYLDITRVNAKTEKENRRGNARLQKAEESTKVSATRARKRVAESDARVRNARGAESETRVSEARAPEARVRHARDAEAEARVRHARDAETEARVRHARGEGASRRPASEIIQAAEERRRRAAERARAAQEARRTQEHRRAPEPPPRRAAEERRRPEREPAQAPERPVRRRDPRAEQRMMEQRAAAGRPPQRRREDPRRIDDRRDFGRSDHRDVHRDARRREDPRRGRADDRGMRDYRFDDRRAVRREDPRADRRMDPRDRPGREDMRRDDRYRQAERRDGRREAAPRRRPVQEWPPRHERPRHTRGERD
ncbi:DUF6542 domain-containing protein [Corynebacterium hansenii]|uniref:DUF6542 domain-containing protein n=1 Tax=Corynebacterium hansenii TaxID=394964 RepID=A0ABV7ZPA5_9CORY|nr:DUF6542 domain-containing protein [Corynebacterium hansenii]WJZ00601.1 hypothetical protein CHAN_09990 [Corynebacterium hansenii]